MVPEDVTDLMFSKLVQREMSGPTTALVGRCCGRGLRRWLGSALGTPRAQLLGRARGLASPEGPKRAALPSHNASNAFKANTPMLKQVMTPSPSALAHSIVRT